MEAHAAFERALVEHVAEDYRNRGYEVVVEPEPQQLPTFMSGYRPDMIVSRGGEKNGC